MRLTEKYRARESWNKMEYRPANFHTSIECYNKLGQLEDILEGYNIKTLEELDSLLSYAKQIKGIEEKYNISSLDDLEKLKNQRMFICGSGESKVELLFDEETQKKLKALEIIKKKRVDVRYLFQCKSLKQYNFIYKGTNESELCLTQEEYKLLKDVLL